MITDKDNMTKLRTRKEIEEVYLFMDKEKRSKGRKKEQSSIITDNNSEASSYKCDTDFKMSSVFKSPNFLYSDCHARIKLRRGNNKIVIISGNAKKTFYLYIE